MSQLEAALTQKIVAGVATPEMFEQLKQIRANKAAAAEKSLAGAENTVINAQKLILNSTEKRSVRSRKISTTIMARLFLVLNYHQRFVERLLVSSLQIEGLFSHRLDNRKYQNPEFRRQKVV